MEAAQCCAQRAQWTEEKYCIQSRVVSFERERPARFGTPSIRDRIHLYHGTGTVVILLGNAQKQMIHTNVNMKQLKELFIDPTKQGDGASSAGSVSVESIFKDYPEEFPACEEVVKSIDSEIVRLITMRSTLNNHVEAEKRRVQEEEAETLRAIEDNSKKRGSICRKKTRSAVKYRLCWKMLDDDAEVQDFLQKIDMNATQCLTSIPTRGVFYSLVNGKSFWIGDTDSIHDDIARAIHTENDTDAALVAITLGTRGRYYAAFSNGKELWYGNKAMDEAIREKPVKMVAFGEAFDSYFVLHEEQGSCSWWNIPEELEEYVDHGAAWVDYIAMGPKQGQFFVSFLDNSWRAGGLNDTDMQFLTSIPGRVKEVTFSEDGFIVRYRMFD